MGCNTVYTLATFEDLDEKKLADNFLLTLSSGYKLIGFSAFKFKETSVPHEYIVEEYFAVMFDLAHIRSYDITYQFYMAELLWQDQVQSYLYDRWNVDCIVPFRYVYDNVVPTIKEYLAIFSR